MSQSTQRRFARVEVPTSQGPSQGGGPPRVTATAQCDQRPKIFDGLRFAFSDSEQVCSGENSFSRGGV